MRAPHVSWCMTETQPRNSQAALPPSGRCRGAGAPGGAASSPCEDGLRGAFERAIILVLLTGGGGLCGRAVVCGVGLEAVGFHALYPLLLPIPLGPDRSDGARDGCRQITPSALNITQWGRHTACLRDRKLLRAAPRVNLIAVTSHTTSRPYTRWSPPRLCIDSYVRGLGSRRPIYVHVANRRGRDGHHRERPLYD